MRHSRNPRSVERRGALFLGLCALVGLLAAERARAQEVREYGVVFGLCRAPLCEKPLVVLRAFTQGGRRFVLAADPESLTTKILPRDGLRFESLSWEQVRSETRGTPYGQAIADSEGSAAAEQDAGIVHTLPRSNGVVLTVDLCPSPRPLDRGLFAGLLRDFGAEEKPVPVSIAITGRWMRAHPRDLAWLRQTERDGEIAVTWVNHSLNHRYDKGTPLSRNFMLEPGTDADVEVLGMERAMIEHGLLPSVFFRFPGLVSDPKLVGRVVGYGLIPIGSDAWLAKNQVPSPGSIVLVHGNGNEPLGIEKLFALVKHQQRAIGDRTWLLSDLPDSVSRAEKFRASVVARTARLSDTHSSAATTRTRSRVASGTRP